MKHKISVTAEHIKNGIKGSFINCPISLAIREKFPILQIVVVSKQNVTTTMPSDPITGEYVLANKFELPESARRFIARFDNDKSVKPFVFILNSDKIV